MNFLFVLKSQGVHSTYSVSKLKRSFEIDFQSPPIGTYASAHFLYLLLLSSHFFLSPFISYSLPLTPSPLPLPSPFLFSSFLPSPICSVTYLLLYELRYLIKISSSTKPLSSVLVLSNT
uniref:Uncharacterized protein n=1 Tax=Cacopsylla melanoneura TaxID=428564 RepID=A0A8D9EDV2_9HEMI